MENCKIRVQIKCKFSVFAGVMEKRARDFCNS
jgi:hypothetical protein